jgi:hypothetical protein
MKNTNFAQGHLLADEVDVDLNVLGTVAMNRVGCHIDSDDVVAVDDSGDPQRNMQFL